MSSDEVPLSAAGEVKVRSLIQDGWFSELIEGSASGQSMCLKIEEVLYQEKSDYQDILVFKSKSYGNVLVLDGIVNCTERDEFSYQEMSAFIPLNAHPNPRNVLVIGGGDSGVVREVSKHPLVETITMCEIDQKVMDASKRYLPTMAKGFASPKLNLYVGDGFKFMEENVNRFDVIITDSSDPIGPGEVLFKREYYELLHRALKPDGIICSQGEIMWLPLAAEYIGELMENIRSIFSIVDYSSLAIPTYTCGQIGLLVCSKNPETNFREPVRTFSPDELEKYDLRYYNSDIHRASFLHPTFVKKILKPKKEN